jgi:hypothetical protein
LYSTVAFATSFYANVPKPQAREMSQDQATRKTGGPGPGEQQHHSIVLVILGAIPHIPKGLRHEV